MPLMALGFSPGLIKYTVSHLHINVWIECWVIKKASVKKLFLLRLPCPASSTNKQLSPSPVRVHELAMEKNPSIVIC
ncbi:hypothetical protein SLA2020_319840 [Shorea laevis]